MIGLPGLEESALGELEMATAVPGMGADMPTIQVPLSTLRPSHLASLVQSVEMTRV